MLMMALKTCPLRPVRVQNIEIKKYTINVGKNLVSII